MVFESSPKRLVGVRLSPLVPVLSFSPRLMVGRLSLEQETLRSSRRERTYLEVHLPKVALNRSNKWRAPDGAEGLGDLNDGQHTPIAQVGRALGL